MGSKIRKITVIKDSSPNLVNNIKVTDSSGTQKQVGRVVACDNYNNQHIIWTHKELHTINVYHVNNLNGELTRYKKSDGSDLILTREQGTTIGDLFSDSNYTDIIKNYRTKYQTRYKFFVGSREYSSLEDLQETTVNNDITIFVRFYYGTFTVKWLTYSGDVTKQSTVTCTANGYPKYSSLEVPEHNKYTYVNSQVYEFIGWSTTKNDTTIRTPTEISNDLTLYPVFNKINLVYKFYLYKYMITTESYVLYETINNIAHGTNIRAAIDAHSTIPEAFEDTDNKDPRLCTYSDTYYYVSNGTTTLLDSGLVITTTTRKILFTQENAFTYSMRIDIGYNISDIKYNVTIYDGLSQSTINTSALKYTPFTQIVELNDILVKIHNNTYSPKGVTPNVKYKYYPIESTYGDIYYKTDIELTQDIFINIYYEALVIITFRDKIMELDNSSQVYKYEEITTLEDYKGSIIKVPANIDMSSERFFTNYNNTDITARAEYSNYFVSELNSNQIITTTNGIEVTQHTTFTRTVTMNTYYWELTITNNSGEFLTGLNYNETLESSHISDGSVTIYEQIANKLNITGNNYRDSSGLYYYTNIKECYISITTYDSGIEEIIIDDITEAITAYNNSGTDESNLFGRPANSYKTIDIDINTLNKTTPIYITLTFVDYNWKSTTMQIQQGRKNTYVRSNYTLPSHNIPNSYDPVGTQPWEAWCLSHSIIPYFSKESSLLGDTTLYATYYVQLPTDVPSLPSDTYIHLWNPTDGTWTQISTVTSDNKHVFLSKTIYVKIPENYSNVELTIATNNNQLRFAPNGSVNSSNESTDVYTSPYNKTLQYSKGNYNGKADIYYWTNNLKVTVLKKYKNGNNIPVNGTTAFYTPPVVLELILGTINPDFDKSVLTATSGGYYTQHYNSSGNLIDTQKSQPIITIVVSVIGSGSSGGGD